MVTLKGTLIELLIARDKEVFEGEGYLEVEFLSSKGVDSLHEYYSAMTEKELLKIYDEYYGIQ